MVRFSSAWLLAAVVGQGAAIRENSLDMLDELMDEKQVALNQQEDEEGEGSFDLEEMDFMEQLSDAEREELSVEDESEYHPFRTCPRGTKKEYKKGEPVHCKYDGELNLHTVSTPSLNGLFSQKGKPVELLYGRDSEAINMTLAFGAEFARAIGDNATFYRLLNGSANDEIERDPEMKSKFTKWIQTVKDSHFSDGHGDFLSGVHGIESDMYAAFFIIEHIAEHAVIEGAIHLLHALEKAGSASVVYGEAFFYKYTGMSIVHMASNTAHALHLFLHYVMTPYLIERSLNLIFVRTTANWLKKEAHAEDFVNRLVYRSECVKDRLAIDQGHNPFTLDNLQQDVKTVCTSHAQTIVDLMERTHKMYEKVFDTIANIGKCLNPGDNPGYLLSSTKRYQSKVYCIERVYRELRESRGAPGQLWSALVFLATVMEETDELLVKPHYGHIMADKFGVHEPKEAAKGYSELRDIRESKNKSFDQRFLTCHAVTATHRAYETSVAVLAESIEKWFQTFARRLIAANVRGTWWPCARVFHKPSEKSQIQGAGAFCKNEHNVWSTEQRHAEQVSCSTPLNYPQWICHKRNWWLIRAKEDAMWCKTAGIYEGYEYRDFGDDHSVCGCSCCKRANAYKSLWPELEAGGH